MTLKCRSLLIDRLWIDALCGLGSFLLMRNLDVVVIRVPSRVWESELGTVNSRPLSRSNLVMIEQRRRITLTFV